MQLFTIPEVLAWEKSIFARGVTAETLMERAGAGVAERLKRLYPNGARVCALIGKGNNGGDGLVAVRHLLEAGWTASLIFAAPERELGLLAKKQWERLGEGKGGITLAKPDETAFAGCAVALDALLGIGNQGEPQGEVARLVALHNRVRSRSSLFTVAVDCPTGLPALAQSEDFTTDRNERALVADLTLTIGSVKDFLAREELSHWVGRLEEISLEERLPDGEAGRDEIIVGSEMACCFPRRSAFSHKNQFGRVLLWGGSVGFTGAAVLAADAALGIGCGLVHLLVGEEIYPVVASKARPEIMVAKDEKALRSWLLPYARVLAIGPGLETGRRGLEKLRWILKNAQVPVVMDAGALVLLAQDKKLLSLARVPVVLTPNVGEMWLLHGGRFEPKERPAVVRAFCRQHPGVILVLKGVRTMVAQHGSPLFFNTTGNPGLAVGGSGDTLMGVIAGLIAQKVPPWDAARMGVWLHGRAADLAQAARGCSEGLLPSDVGRALGAAIASLRDETGR